MSGFLKNRRLVTGLLCGVLLLVTVGLGAVAVLKNPERFQNVMNNSSSASAGGSVSSSEGNQPEEGQGESPSQGEPTSSEGDPNQDNPNGEAPEGDGTVTEDGVFFNRPSEMRAVYITAGVDYLTGERTGADAIRADIDAAILTAKELQMNSVIFDLKAGEKNIWQKSDLPAYVLEMDPLEYAIGKAREQGLYVYAIFELLEEAQGDAIVPIRQLDAKGVETVTQRCKQFAQSYQLDGILLDGYYNPTVEESYAWYRANGGGVGFENHQLALTQSAFSSVADTLHSEVRGLQVGMLTEAVWANKDYNEEGSVTNASYTTRYSGNADNKAYVEQGYVDFIAVKAFSPTTDANVPFKSVVGWWGSLAADNEVPFYVVHAADKACTDAAGWTEYDQLTRQLIELSKTAGYSGSAFNSLSRMKEDPKNSTTTVIKFFNDEVNPKHILTELAVTEPKQKTYSTFEQSVTFKGASDPNTEVTINGTKISTDQNGYFTVNKELVPGLNKFTIVHKGRTDVYNITRQVQVLKEISPMGNITVDGGMKVTITATAYKDAKVYAVVGGQTISMQIVDTEGDDSNRDTSYVKFEGVYTAPAAGTALQEVGNIMIYGQAQGQNEQKQGAYIRVNKKAVLGDGMPIQVIADQAETFPTSVLNDYSDQGYYPLPKGALDYTVGNEIIYKDGDKTFSYYILASNLRVYSKDIKAVSDTYGADNNNIAGMSVESTTRHTDVIFRTQQQVSYTAGYDGNNFTISFHYTSGHPDGMNLSENPLFTQSSWSGSTVSLRLRKSGQLIGYRAFYDSSGNLVLRFNNPPAVSGGDLSGVKVVVDPGHGGPDPGASGFLPAYPESVINRMLSEAISDELRARGASVVMLQSDVSPKLSLESRVALTRSADPHLFISIHCNSSNTNFSATGTEVYYFNAYSRAFSGYASAAIANALGTNNRGGKFGYYYVTRDTQYPGVLVETGFLSNEREYKKLIDTGYQAEVASGVADAVSQYFRSLGGQVITGSQSQGGSASRASVDGVNVTESLTIAVGESQTLQPQISPSNASNHRVSYSSSQPAVATVDKNGNVFGVKEGETTITVETEEGGYTASCKVKVSGQGGQGSGNSGGNGGAVEQIKLNVTQLELEMGNKQQLTATFTPANAANKQLKWESEDTDIATVSANGTVQAVGEGETYITAMAVDGEVYGDCLVIVRPKGELTGAQSLTVDAKNLTMVPGEAFPLEVTVKSSGNKNITISFSSSNQEVATVDEDGVIEAHEAGKATITISGGGQSATCSVTVE